MSDHEKQELVDRLFQDHEIRIRVTEEIMKEVRSEIRAMSKMVYLTAGGMAFVIGGVLLILGKTFL
ncbi:MAG: hypothetical protein ISN28_14145 [Ectothiorhodospiraceae bacterium AqS1]|nr:hypothetical protein [Ectothiorhodospiraceae bacterium AqS1]